MPGKVFQKCEQCESWYDPDAKQCPYCPPQRKGSLLWRIVFSVFAGKALVMGGMFWMDAIEPSPSPSVAPAYTTVPTIAVEPTPTSTKSPAHLAAESAAKKLSDADGVETDYTWELVETAQKCGYGIDEMAEIILFVGDSIEETRSDIEVPRRKAMFVIRTEKPSDRDCAIFLAAVTVLIQDMP